MLYGALDVIKVNKYVFDKDYNKTHIRIDLWHYKSEYGSEYLKAKWCGLKHAMLPFQLKLVFFWSLSSIKNWCYLWYKSKDEKIE